VTRIARIALDLLAQLGDEGVDRPRERCSTVAPHRPQQLLARDHTVGVVEEVLQQLELP
jgi:hypothetical protein